MPGTQGSTSLTGQHELTQDFQEEQSCQRNAFPKQPFSSGREAALLPLISLTSHVQGWPASKCQRDVLGDSDSPPEPKHNCDVRELETGLENQTSHCSAICKASNSPALLLANNHSPKNKAGTTCSTPALFTAKAHQENCPKYKEAQSCSFTLLIIPPEKNCTGKCGSKAQEKLQGNSWRGADLSKVVQHHPSPEPSSCPALWTARLFQCYGSDHLYLYHARSCTKTRQSTQVSLLPVSACFAAL